MKICASVTELVFKQRFPKTERNETEILNNQHKTLVKKKINKGWLSKPDVFWCKCGRCKQSGQADSERSPAVFEMTEGIHHGCSRVLSSCNFGSV